MILFQRSPNDPVVFGDFFPFQPIRRFFRNIHTSQLQASSGLVAVDVILHLPYYSQLSSVINALHLPD
jgi:hypothetical protein